MPYAALSDLPVSVTYNVPEQAQEIYLAAYNQAWKEYRSSDDGRDGAKREETVLKLAWAAVKKEYAQGPDARWHRKKPGHT